MTVANELSRRGRRVHLAYLDPRRTLLDALSECVPVRDLGRRGRVSLAAVNRLRAYILDNEIESVACMNIFPLFYTRLALATVPRGRTPRVLLFENTSEIRGPKSRAIMQFFRPLMRSADRIVFGSADQRAAWLNRYGLQEAKCRIVYNGIDETHFSPDGSAPAVAPGLAEGDFVIGAVGSLLKNKNHAELVAALATVRQSVANAKLVVCGDGPELENLKLQADRLGVADSVVFPGAVEDVRPWLQRMDVFVLSSIAETFSNATLEAMATATAVISSSTGGMPEMIEHGNSGLLYRGGDVKELAGLIVALAQDPQRRAALGAQGRESVLQRFSLTAMVSEYEQLLYPALAGAAG